MFSFFKSKDKNEHSSNSPQNKRSQQYKDVKIEYYCSQCQKVCKNVFVDTGLCQYCSNILKSTGSQRKKYKGKLVNKQCLQCKQKFSDVNKDTGLCCYCSRVLRAQYLQSLKGIFNELKIYQNQDLIQNQCKQCQYICSDVSKQTGLCVYCTNILKANQGKKQIQYRQKKKDQKKIKDQKKQFRKYSPKKLDSLVASQQQKLMYAQNGQIKKLQSNFQKTVFISAHCSQCKFFCEDISKDTGLCKYCMRILKVQGKQIKNLQKIQKSKQCYQCRNYFEQISEFGLCQDCILMHQQKQEQLINKMQMQRKNKQKKQYKKQQKIFIKNEEKMQEEKEDFVPVIKQKSDIKKQKGINEFQEFMICPISQQLMQNPFMISKCGHHFQKKPIFQWVQRHHNCPICRVQVNKENLSANFQLKQMIQIFKKQKK